MIPQFTKDRKRELIESRAKMSTRWGIYFSDFLHFRDVREAELS